ncbi:transcriptional regulator [Capsulimonas corticalis]|uniref:Transcriptional regulator n=1 Tax=Capsulimonas corticalis TaxID=2219043 RepID=A0A402D656_9BACT|nr:AraC family transcriptional regulator [Capsulimonas corticalis]BDI32501.1 transcriptional regulator [Capsulimonas corticalis]
MEIPRLCFSQIAAPCAAFHAAHAIFSSEGQTEVRLHRHDFHEWLVVLEGEARHLVNGEETALRRGQLVLIRPDDCHAIAPRPGGVEFVNVAFPEDVWEDLVRATGLEEEAQEWSESDLAVSLEMTPDQRLNLRAEAMAAVRAYHDRPTRLAFSQFWSAAAGALAQRAEGRDGGSGAAPLWMRNALAWAQSADMDELSLEAFVEASGVSFGHLSRTLKSRIGQTPTEFLNEIRVKRAAYELATTDRDIAAIAFDCGFENLSYFYRRFRQHHGKAPRSYREEARRSLPL